MNLSSGLLTDFVLKGLILALVVALLLLQLFFVNLLILTLILLVSLIALVISLIILEIITVVTPPQTPPNCSVTISGPSCICKGATKTFTATGTPAGGTYSWSTKGNISEVGHSYNQATIRADDDSDVATLTVTYKTGNCEKTDSTAIKLSSIAKITGPDCVCIGQSVTFSATTDLPGCEADVQWRSGSNTGTGPTFTIQLNSVGAYEIEARCGSTRKIFEVKVAELGDIKPNINSLVPSNPTSFSRTAAGWVASIPSAAVRFSVDTTLCDCNDINWTIAGPSVSPTTARGTTIDATFSAPGVYTITARCGNSTKTRTVRFCDYKAILETAANYYGNSINFIGVHVDFSGTVTGRNWTFHNDVYIAKPEDLHGWADANGCPITRLFVHEFGHVWEYQHGQLQMTLGVVDQIINTITPINVYDYGGAPGLHQAVSQGRTLNSFNREQQARIFEDDFTEKSSSSTTQYAQDLATLTGPALASPPTNP